MFLILEVNDRFFFIFLHFCFDLVIHTGHLKVIWWFKKNLLCGLAVMATNTD